MTEDKGLSRSEREEKVLQFWKDNHIFEKTLEKDSPEGNFVFYEGPPTANGRPAIHHLEARSFKDAIPRYRTMRGFRVPRRAGWDTHGLPVELEVEKTLGLKSKKEIENFGIALFNKKCRESVGTYINEWSRFTDRIGYWVDFDDAYYTYDNEYIEKVWSILSHVEDRKLLYKDYKVLPWCPRCETALSSHELAQGYKDVKDLSLYVKFKVRGQDNTYLVAWTTTPWTLPGNIALAVGSNIKYAKYNWAGENIIIAKDRSEKWPGHIQEEFLGEDLVGLEYEPLYPFVADLALDSERGKLDKAYKVYAADFVTTEDGTGIVHTAVMYGQEDFDLATKLGLPKVHLVSPDASFMPGTGWLEGRSVVDENLAVDILKDLKERGFLFDKENYTHSYPFCWRCKTRLIYYARDSWYIRMSALREDLMKENEEVNWEPDYIKDGRFGEWLKEVKDWAISRERYWGTPLPVWVADNGERIVVDSIDTLKKYSKGSGNTYFVMRHGGTEGNKKEVVSFAREADDHLTQEGKDQARTSAEGLKGKIDLIISSTFVRARETSAVVAEVLGLKEDQIVYDPRLIEINPGEYDGKNWNEYHARIYNTGPDWFNHRMPGGESLADVRKRVGEALYDAERTYKGRNILFVTHGGPAWLFFVLAGLFEPTNDEYKAPDLEAKTTKIFTHEFKRFENAEVRELSFIPLPHDEDFATDLHRPYIDDILLEKDGREYRRVKEVMDVWFDSGSMPFAQDPHNILYPADFISEGIDQTRGWFYTLHAIGTLMERGRAFKNVICLGLLLDKDGKKMSKSVGNVVDPWEEMNKYGVDVLRFWMYSINQPGENKNYDDRTVKEVEKRIFNLLDNVYTFYELYRDTSLESAEVVESTNVLDQWILTRLNELVATMTKRLDDYQLLEPARDFRDFVDDLSTWYVRRSRERLKEGDKEAKQTLYVVLKTLSKLLAPLAPFAAEELYQKLRLEGDPLSVHLEDWPKVTAQRSESALVSMKEVRRIVSLALEARSKATLKIRQPLSTLTVRSELGEEFLEIVADEVNVKQVLVDNALGTDVVLDTTLTPELIEEGEVREVIRSIQELRKEKNLTPSDVLEYDVPEGEKKYFKKYGDEIKRVTNVSPHL